jgi:hypothetical protein
MMDELKNKIKAKINIAYNHIKNGYKTQVKAALEFIQNFIKIGIIPDSYHDRTKNEEIQKAQKILKEVNELLEANNIPDNFLNFRKKIEEELESEKELKSDYDNYEEVIKKKINFINENFRILNEKTLPGVFTNIKNGVKDIITNNIEGIEVNFENGKIVIKEKISMKGTTKEVSGLLTVGLGGLGVAAAVVATATPEVVGGGILVGKHVVQTEILALLELKV